MSTMNEDNLQPPSVMPPAQSFAITIHSPDDVFTAYLAGKEHARMEAQEDGDESSESQVPDFCTWYRERFGRPFERSITVVKKR